MTAGSLAAPSIPDPVRVPLKIGFHPDLSRRHFRIPIISASRFNGRQVPVLQVNLNVLLPLGSGRFGDLIVFLDYLSSFSNGKAGYVVV